MRMLSTYEQQFVCSERHLLHNVFQALGLAVYIKHNVQSITVVTKQFRFRNENRS